MELLGAEVDLMSRTSDGLEVFLMWHRETNLVSIAMHDLSSGESRAFPVPSEKAMHAFMHPFAYLPREVTL